MISAVILTKNEEKNIGECLKTLWWCDEIIIIDDYSNDKTLKNVSKFQRFKVSKIEIFKRHLDGDFAGQRNFGLEKATGDWVLFVDADERISSELAEEIQSQIQMSNLKTQKAAGFYLIRSDFMFGRELKYGEAGDIKLLRLARKNVGTWKRSVHEVWHIKGAISVLSSPLLHYPHQDVAQFIDDVNNYSDLHALALQNEGKKSGFCQIMIYPAAKFIDNFFFRQGFRDGMSGLIVAVIMSFHSFLSRAKLYFLEKNKPYVR